jgi:hypothetical protein
MSCAACRIDRTFKISATIGEGSSFFLQATRVASWRLIDCSYMSLKRIKKGPVAWLTKQVWTNEVREARLQYGGSSSVHGGQMLPWATGLA